MSNRPRILFLEDEEAIRYVLGRVLGPFYDVDTCQSVEAALTLCSSNQYDLLLVDIVLRQFDSGFDFISRVRQLPAYAEIPILVHSALADHSSEAHALELGATDYLRRPSSNTDLLAKLHHLLLDRDRP